MKTKLLAAFTVMGLLVCSASHASGPATVSVRVDTPEFGIRIGHPGFYPGPVVIVPPPVYVPPRVIYAPPPAIYAPVIYAPYPHHHGHRHGHGHGHGHRHRSSHEHRHYDHVQYAPPRHIEQVYIYGRR